MYFKKSKKKIVQKDVKRFFFLINFIFLFQSILYFYFWPNEKSYTKEYEITRIIYPSNKIRNRTNIYYIESSGKETFYSTYDCKIVYTNEPFVGKKIVFYNSVLFLNIEIIKSWKII
jgi:hypothetical protein